MNKIVLLNSPMDLIIDKRHFPPLGLASIAALLRSKGYVCDVMMETCQNIETSKI